MKSGKLFIAAVVTCLTIGNVQAQLPDGSSAPDFTVTDLNGNTHSLYADYLDNGYNVILEFAATWCGQCWWYHEDGILQELWENHGPAGQPGVLPSTTDDVVVLWIEGDPGTSVAEIYNTTGATIPMDWTQGISFPMINDDNLAWIYDIPHWRTIYSICPDGSLGFTDPYDANWNYIGAQGHYDYLQNCGELSIDAEEEEFDINIYPVPAEDILNIEFPSTENAIVEIVDLLGRVVLSQIASNQATFSVSDLESGSYIVNIKTDSRAYTTTVLIQ